MIDEQYGRYLCSRDWSVKKRAVKQRCKGVCERCNYNVMEHVHHLTYVRKFRERLEDLQGLCKQCHDFIHAISDIDPKTSAELRAVKHKAIHRKFVKRARKRRSPSDRVFLKMLDRRLTDTYLTALLDELICLKRIELGIDQRCTKSFGVSFK